MTREVKVGYFNIIHFTDYDNFWLERNGVRIDVNKEDLRDLEYVAARMIRMAKDVK